MTGQELYEKAIEVLGDNQLDKLVEECAELIQAREKLRIAQMHGTDIELSAAMDNFIEEQEDVEIMLCQMRARNPKKDQRSRIKHTKLNRLANLLGETYEPETEYVE